MAKSKGFGFIKQDSRSPPLDGATRIVGLNFNIDTAWFMTRPPDIPDARAIFARAIDLNQMFLTIEGEDISNALLGENFYRRPTRHFKRAAPILIAVYIKAATVFARGTVLAHVSFPADFYRGAELQ
jgi:hypothetical protein